MSMSTGTDKSVNVNESETTDPSAPVERPTIWVRAFIMVLPIGLAFMVPLSLWIYYQRKYQPEAAASQYAVMLRKDLNADDFARYQRIMTQDIGERTLAHPDNLAAATAFIESTMGYDNMGYAVQRQSFDAKGRPVVNLVAELPGQSKPEEIVLVLAAYDAADVSGIAAMMCVAHALTGTNHARTIRFAAVVNTQEPDSSSNGLWRLAQSELNLRSAVKTILPLSAFPAAALASWTDSGTAVQPVPPLPGNTDPLTALKEIVTQLETAVDPVAP